MQRLKEIFNKDEILINSFYERENDVLTMVFKNVHTGKKRVITLDEPRNRICVAKNKNMKDYTKFIPIEEVDVRYVREKYKDFNVARELGYKHWWDTVKEGKVKSDFIYLNKRLFSADIGLADNVIREQVKFFTVKDGDSYIMDFPKVDSFHLGGLDIETDINVSDDREAQPVILNTYIDGKDWSVYTKALINPEYKGQKEVMDNPEAFYKEAIDIIKSHIEGIDLGDDPKSVKKANNIKALLLSKIEMLSLKIEFTNREDEVIRDVMQEAFSKKSPDFLLIYNAQFDINHQNTRYEALGYNIHDLYRYKNNSVYTYFNTKNQNPEFQKRFHHFDVRNPTKILDQMLIYYQLRKAATFARHSLDATANRELGVGKLDYSSFCNWIGDFPYVAWKEFAIYNIVDVLMMLFIDLVTSDTYAIVYKRLKMASEWGSINRSLMETNNTFDNLVQLQGYEVECNRHPIYMDLKKDEVEKLEKSSPGITNVIKQLRTVGKYAKEEFKKDRHKNPYRIEGGLVTSPNKIADIVRMSKSTYKVAIKTWAKLANCADLDATSMYPNNIQVNNGCTTTLVGKMVKVGNDDSKDIGRKVALSFINRNITDIGSHLFSLPSLNDIFNDYYKLDPIKKEIHSNIYNEEPELIIDEKKYKKEVATIKRLWKNNYRTTYNDKDMEAFNIPSNNLFITSDNVFMEFSYYSSKVEIVSDIPFNEYLGLSGKGFICSSISQSNKLTNLNDFYQEVLIPRVDKANYELITNRHLTNEEIDEIMSADRTLYNFMLHDNISINLVKNILFFDTKNSKDLSYELYRMKEDETLFKVVIKSSVPLGKGFIRITQSFIIVNDFSK